MKFVKICLLTTIIVASMNLDTLAQVGDYQSFTTLKPDMQRKVFANELFLTPDGKYLVVNYGDKPTFIVAYAIEDWKQAAMFRLTDWVDFATAYSDTVTQQFYVISGDSKVLL